MSDFMAKSSATTKHASNLNARRQILVDINKNNRRASNDRQQNDAYDWRENTYSLPVMKN